MKLKLKTFLNYMYKCMCMSECCSDRVCVHTKTFHWIIVVRNCVHTKITVHTDMTCEVTSCFYSLIPAALSPIPIPEAEEDLTEYRFPKFTAIYFQGVANHSYIRQALKQPLLALKNKQDKLVCETSLTSY